MIAAVVAKVVMMMTMMMMVKKMTNPNNIRTEIEEGRYSSQRGRECPT